MLVDHVQLLQPIEPDQLEMLQRVFDRACEAKLASKRTVEATELAAQIISFYQHGVHGEHQLYVLVAGD
ncbi:hypothetical protein YH62_24065 [Rhizobium sp. LC145]|nr:hypothetical protein YH62_24065 [Rhizobium sp. LC145]